MKKNALLLLGCCLCISSYAQFKDPRPVKRPPNIIVFLVDDMGWEDSSVPFWYQVTATNKRFHTPHMERLAREGMKFTNAYATPVCTPSRVSMLTGMNAAHHGVTNWTSPRKDVSSDVPDETLHPASWNTNGYSPVRGIAHTVYATPLPALLREAGYYTIHAGKAHWGAMGTPGANPYNMGFLVNIAGHAAGHPQSYLSEENYGNMSGKATAQAVPDLEEYYGTGTFLTEALTREAIKTLDEPIKRKQPFYLYLAHYAVHTPLQADRKYYQRYLNEGLDSTAAKYAAMIEGMDQSLGTVMDYLRTRQIDGNTIILFMSDNGGLSLAPPREGQLHTQNAPLRAGKGSVYEGGIREPMLVKWPGVTAAGSTATQPVIIEDFFPAILEMAGIQLYNAVQSVDGNSFVPILRNPAYTDSSRALVWHYPNKWIPEGGPGINYKSALRQGRWKVVYDLRTGAAELYDLQTDIGEQRNLAAQEPQRTTALVRLLSQRLQAWKAPMPVLKATGQPLPWPGENRP
ncbi:sulfatase [Chitinophaga nivalis]|uniref:Sulfatase n=1 Tax=Chitinophaga nivalis TaxID=2991709 RepID=A0ABT3IGE7_9BACT|nr:sulfatase [Chitinophaga nivalis]MCW3467279.1 sulfatase [Chitinophaga nivalis]MCW3483029.1 sulfatase [Chitinophaga nivalis]